MQKKTRNLVTCALGIPALLAAACSDGGKAARAEKPRVAVETVAATRASLTESVRVVGTLAPKFSADLKSEITAVVAEVFVTEWVPVAKGTVLARLDAREDEAAVEARRAAFGRVKAAVLVGRAVAHSGDPLAPAPSRVLRGRSDRLRSGGLVRAFLEQVRARYAGQYWHALSREVARFWRTAMGGREGG